MDEKLTELLAQYDIEVYRAGRVKGAWIMETDRGLKNLSSCSLSEGKLDMMQQVKLFVREKGCLYTDLPVATKEQKFLAQGAYGEMFLLRDWFCGEECDTGRTDHIVRTVQALAELHRCIEGFPVPEDFPCQSKLTEVLDKRNRELRRVRSYIRSKKQKNSFEQHFLAQFPEQFACAEEATDMLDEDAYNRYYEKAVSEGCITHGNYTHHSVLLLAGNEVAVTGFEKVAAGICIQDFYLLFRKMLEKWEWDVSLGDLMLETYERARPIPKEERNLLRLLLCYPEKFWKVANQYYNNRKSWIPEKNMQKLLQTMEQAERKELCIRSLFGQ